MDINGTTGNDVLYGSIYAYKILADYGNDVVYGGSGGDDIDGSYGADYLHGESGNDTLDGGYGTYTDYLYGGSESDRLYGRNGDDVLVGGSGSDYLLGGSGDDRFVYETYSDSNWDDGVDVIDAFQATYANDLIDLQLLDADLTTSGGQAFGFVGYSTQGGSAGELVYRYETINGYDYTFIDGYADNSGNPALTIALHGTFTLSAGDFLL